MPINSKASKTKYLDDIPTSDHLLKWQSVTGVDIIAGFRFDDEYYDSTKEDGVPAFRVFGELQTISISGTRSVNPVRCLGESAARAYTRGARTFAGSLIFTMFSKDPLEEVVRMSSEQEVYGREPFFIDQIPEFDIVINAVNEFGAVSQAIIGGVTLTNYGTTLSIHDIYTEISYTYVARFYIPMTDNIKALVRVRNLIEAGLPSAASGLAQEAMVNAKNSTAEEVLARRMLEKHRRVTKTGRFVREYEF